MKTEEGNAGVEKHTPEETKAFRDGWIAKHRLLSDQNAELRQSLSELINMYEAFLTNERFVSNYPGASEVLKSAIERAKLLSNEKE